MNISSPAPTNNTEIWASLKQAISTSSGFEHWASQQATVAGEAFASAKASPLEDRSKLNLDDLVQRYLRETLETLAY